MKYRTKPVEIRAHQWDGTFDSYRAIAYLIGKENIRHADADKDWKLEVYDYLQKQWIPVMDRDFVILGMKGEAYPCNEEVFNAKYEIAFAKGGVTSATR